MVCVVVSPSSWLKVVLLSLGLLFNSIAGAVEPADSVECIDNESHVSYKQFILPVSLMTLGTIGVYNGAFKELNGAVNDRMGDWRRTDYFKADDYIQYLPVAVYLGLGPLVPSLAKHSFKERVAVGVTAYLFMSTTLNIAKYSFKEKRPDSNARQSFPSGHTATAFTGAELVRMEYGMWPGIAMYTVATGVAFLRVYNGRHWLNDVIAGAGLGILSVRLAHLMLPVYKRWFKWDRTDKYSTMAVMPVYDPVNRQAQMSMMYIF